MLPTQGRITQTFNTKVDYIAGRTKHEAVDIVTDGSQPIRAVADGVISKTVDQYDESKTNGYGNEISIEYDNGMIDRFCHCQHKSLLMFGTHVKAGQQIAMTGRTGYRVPTTTWHTHFERYLNGNRIDPLDKNNQPNQFNEKDMQELTELKQMIKDTQNHLQKIENMLTTKNGENRIENIGHNTKAIAEKVGA